MDARTPAVNVSSFSVKLGAYIGETYRVFASWDVSRPDRDNFEAIIAKNAVAASSRSWLQDIVESLRYRYEPSGRDRALVDLAAGGCPIETWQPILLWHLTRRQFLLRDFILNFLYPARERGVAVIRTPDLYPHLATLAERGGHVARPWTPETNRRVSNGLLKTAAEFGHLEGTLTRRFRTPAVPDDAFIYVAHALHEGTPRGTDVVNALDWRLFALTPGAVEREFLRLHQFGRLHYEVAGSLAQLTLPQPTALAFARTLVP
jgi:hypothetical protein